MKTLFMSFLLIATSLQAAIKTNWEEVKGGRGVKVFAGDVPGTEIVAFRGEAVLNFPIQQVASVLYDMKRKTEWIHNVKEAKVLRQLGERERVEYNYTKTPWPLSNRDFVFTANVWSSPDKKEVKFILNNTKDDLAPPREGVVRGELRESVYHLTAIDQARTKIVVSILADPKGSVPKWLVNLFQRMWPINTISGIRKELMRPEFKVDPKVSAFFAEGKEHQKL